MEARRELVDARLPGPAHWRGGLRRELRGRPATAEERGRVAAAFDRLAAGDAERPLHIDGLLELHRDAVGGGAFRSRGVHVGPRRPTSIIHPAPAHLPALVEDALGRADGSQESVLLATARLHLDLLLIHPFPDGNGRTTRLAVSWLLMRAGYRSTLFTAAEQHFAGDPAAYPEAFGRLAASEITASDRDEWIATALQAMDDASAAVAAFRERELRLRRRLRELGLRDATQTAALVAFDTGRPMRGTVRAAMRDIAEPLPASDLDPALHRQLRRLRAEERDVTLALASRPSPPRLHVPAGPARRCGAPAASVVVPAHRASPTIAACLRALQGQDFGEPYEVIVVASGGDATADIVRHGFPSVTVLAASDRLTPGAARNAGVAAASGDVVAFIAADCVAQPDWLRRRVEAHRDGSELVGGFVDCRRPSTAAGYAQYFAKFWGMLALDRTQMRQGGPLFHLSYSRQVLDRFGPFPERGIAGEDTEYNHRLVTAGIAVHFDSAIRVTHLNQDRLADVMAGQREQGAATGAVCSSAGIGGYYVPSIDGGPFTPFRLWWRALAVVTHHRRDLLGPFLGAAPLTLIAIRARRRAFRRAYRAPTRSLNENPPQRSENVQRRVAVVTGLRRPDVSVVVPAYNEAAVIGRCLEAVLAQRDVAFEVVVADDGSTDGTAAVATALGVPVLMLSHRGPATAKNAGAAAGRGHVVVFLDADLIVQPGALARLVAPILAGDEVGTFTREIGVDNPRDRWSRCWSLNRRVHPGDYMPDGVPDRWANFRAVDRAAFLEAGGYDDIGYGEDMTLAPKLNATAAAVPGARMLHHNPDSIGEVWANARWVGRGARVRELPHVARRYSPWRSLRRGLVGARQQPRFLAFAFVYDFGVLSGYLQSALRPGRHAK